jgi:hypothetical protein
LTSRQPRWSVSISRRSTDARVRALRSPHQYYAIIDRRSGALPDAGPGDCLFLRGVVVSVGLGVRVLSSRWKELVDFVDDALRVVDPGEMSGAGDTGYSPSWDFWLRSPLLLRPDRSRYLVTLYVPVTARDPSAEVDEAPSGRRCQ